MERATDAEVFGCGSTQTDDMTLNIQTTTGGNFTVSLNAKDTVDYLKKIVSKKLKVSKDRICLLHRDRQLTDGTLEENSLLDGARVVLLPSVETGLLNQRHENSVIQALESLNDTQVNDFLSGKSPLNLTMRLGDHMMLIQLQLSTLNSSRARATKAAANSPIRISKRNLFDPIGSQGLDGDDYVKATNLLKFKARAMAAEAKVKADAEKAEKAEKAAPKTAEKPKTEEPTEKMDTSEETVPSTSTTATETDQSPLKSLSSLVSGPMEASTSKHMDAVNAVKEQVRNSLAKMLAESNLSRRIEHAVSMMQQPETSSDDSDTADQTCFLAETPIDEYPMENLFNAAACDDSMMDREITKIATTIATENTPSAKKSPTTGDTTKCKRFYLAQRSKFKLVPPNEKHKEFMQSLLNKHQKRVADGEEEVSERKLLLQPTSKTNELPTHSVAHESVASTSRAGSETQVDSQPAPVPDTKALIEASKNLTQTLKKLSKQVLINKSDPRNPQIVVPSKTGPGAVIETMKHHGRGVYSGTFSGTLNPALQDSTGRPKRDISTIIHILNDLLCATPSIKLKEPKSTASTSTDHTCRTCSKASCPRLGEDPPCECAELCHCQRLVPECDHDKNPGEDVCDKCNTAKTLAMENSKTKCKLEQLRLVMQQKKQRREARKQKPYAAPQRSADQEEGEAEALGLKFSAQVVSELPVNYTTVPDDRKCCYGE